MRRRPRRAAPFGRFDTGSWLVLALAAAMACANLALALYQGTLPTDGWVRDVTRGDAYVLWRPLAPGPTPLRAGDALIAVDGRPLAALEERALTLDPGRPPSWRAGGVARYTVLRDGQRLELAVPLRTLPVTAALSGGELGAAGVVVGLAQLAAMLVVFLLRPRVTAARLLLLYAVLSWQIAMIPRPVDLLDSWAFWPAEWFGELKWTFGILPVLVYLVLAFPVRKRFLRSRPLLTLATVYGLGPLVFAAALATAPGPWSAQFFSTMLTVTNVWFAALVVVLVSSFAHSFLTVRDPVARAQLRWVALGFVVGVGGGIVAFFLASLAAEVGGALPEISAIVPALFLLLLPLSLAVAILRYRLFDIDLVIRRTLVYGALSASLALMYWGGVALLRGLAPAGRQDSDVAIVASTLAVAALFAPLRRRVQRIIDRRFYRSRFDAARTVQAYGARLRDEVDLDAVAERLVSAAEQTMRPAHANVWLRPTGRPPARTHLPDGE